MQIITHKTTTKQNRLLNIKNVMILLAILILIGEFILISTHKSIWRDEAFSVLLSRSSIFDIFIKTSKDVNPPLFYLIIKPFVKIFGHQENLLRAVNFIFIIPTLFILRKIIYLINQKLKISRKLLLVIILSLFVTNNVFLQQLAEIRTYSLLIFEITLSIYLIVKTFYYKKPIPWIWLCLNLIIITYTHNTGIFWVISIFLSLSLEFLLKKNKLDFYKLVKIYIVLFMIYMPWFLVQLNQIQLAAQNFWVNFDKKKSLDQFIGLYVGMERIDELKNQIQYQRYYQISSFLTYLGIIRLSFIKKWRWLSLSFLLSLNIMYFYSYFYTPILYSRYLGFIASSAFILNIIGIISLWQLKPKYFFRTISLSSFLVIIYLQISLIPDLFNKLNHTDYHILAESNKEIAIFTPEELDYMSCRYYRDDCKFLRMEALTKYTGINLLSQFKTEELNNVQNYQNIYLLYKDYHQDAIAKMINSLDYNEIYKIYLGDHSILSEYKKSFKPSL